LKSASQVWISGVATVRPVWARAGLGPNPFFLFFEEQNTRAYCLYYSSLISEYSFLFLGFSLCLWFWSFCPLLVLFVLIFLGLWFCFMILTILPLVDSICVDLFRALILFVILIFLPPCWFCVCLFVDEWWFCWFLQGS
jgi:hypothetical protein